MDGVTKMKLTVLARAYSAACRHEEAAEEAAREARKAASIAATDLHSAMRMFMGTGKSVVVDGEIFTATGSGVQRCGSVQVLA